MLRFIKSNKKFSTVLVTSVFLILVLCYGLAVRNVVAIGLGATILMAFLIDGFIIASKEFVRLRGK